MNNNKYKEPGGLSYLSHVEGEAEGDLIEVGATVVGVLVGHRNLGGE